MKLMTLLAAAGSLALHAPISAEPAEPLSLEQAKDCYILHSVVAEVLEKGGREAAAYAALDTSLTWYAAILARLETTTDAIDAEIRQESAELRAVYYEAIASDAATRKAMQERLEAIKDSCDALEKLHLRKPA